MGLDSGPVQLMMEAITDGGFDHGVGVSVKDMNDVFTYQLLFPKDKQTVGVIRTLKIGSSFIFLMPRTKTQNT